jgi:type IV pilus assembly protein PilF
VTRAFVALLVLALLGCAGTEPNPSQNRSRQAAEINTQLGIEYLRAGRTDIALEKLEKARQIDSRHAPVYNGLGLLFERVGEDDKADAAFRRAIELDPVDANFRNNYGAFLCRRGKLMEADAQFRKGLEDRFFQSQELIYTNAGICARKRSDPAEAERYLRLALNHNPRFPVATLQLAKLSFDQKRYTATREYLSRYWELADYSPESLRLAVMNERHAGNASAAKFYAALLREKFPDSQANVLLKR